MTNLILCGGVGSRLWPLSRTHLPKQFARILPGDSLFEATVRRNLELCDRIVVASNADQAFLAATQLRGLEIAAWDSIVEPVGRNTAPAVALACLQLKEDETVLVSPSDHFIGDTEAYSRAVKRAAAIASGGKLVTFGIRPEYPETGFGYIQTDSLDQEKVLAFTEKPDLDRARSYLGLGNYWWNSGMFCFRAGTFLSELERLSPEVFNSVKIAFGNAKVIKNSGDGAQSEPGMAGGTQIAPRLSDMAAIPSISIDYAVMEKSAAVACVPCEIGWTDLGSFDALYGHVAKDQRGNSLVRGADPVLVDSGNNLVLGGTRTIALVDVDGLMVVESPDAILIAKRGSGQKVKEVVDLLKSRDSALTEDFPRVERPWGSHTLLHEERGCRVKRVEVRPGQSLSMHAHKLRSEHWTVAFGEADVQLDGSRVHLQTGQSMVVGEGVFHRLENNGQGPLIIVETHLGEILDEGDIERVSESGKPAFGSD